MAFIYDDVSVRGTYQSTTPYEDLPALKFWGNHYRNSLELAFYIKNGSTLEKRQAGRELEICERKMKHWARHPNYNANEAARIASDLKRQWA